MFSKDTYIKRREKLLNSLKTGVAVFISNPETPFNCPSNHMKYRQDSSFYYFFGLQHPRLIATIDFDTNETIIFGDNIDIEDIIWMGEIDKIEALAERVGVTTVRPYAEFSTYIKSKNYMYLPQYRAENKILLSSILEKTIEQIEQGSSDDFVKAIVNIRSYKEPQEIEEIEKCAEMLYDMHTTMMRNAKPGVSELAIAGLVESIPVAKGGRVSFPVILSQNGQILHNHDHSQICEEGRFLLCDAGAESTTLYATDATRTVPVGGRFTELQKSVYNIVLKANTTAIEMIKPGIPYVDIHLETARIIFSGLKELGLTKGDVNEAVSQGAHALFYPHGLGHMLGLDVHDMEDLNETLVGYDDEIKRSTQFGLSGLRLGRRLEENFVITVEPGLYFIPDLIDKWQSENKFTEFLNYDEINKYRNFGGIRIEDDILVTQNGSRVIGKPIPKTVEEIEQIMNS